MPRRFGSFSLVHFLLRLVHLTLHVDGVDDGARLLCGVDGGPQRLLAPLVNTVREENQHLAPALLSSDLIRGEIDGVIEQRLRARIRSASPGIRLGRVQQAGALLHLLFARSQILQQFHLAIEVDDETAILCRLHHGVDEFDARRLLVRRRTALSPAGIHQDAEDQRLAGRRDHGQDVLTAAVFVERQLVLGRIRDRCALLIADQHRHSDRHSALRRRCGRRGRFLRRCLGRNRQGQQATEQGGAEHR